jgi:hypothetical protein
VIGRGTYEKVLTFDTWPYQEKKVIVLSTTLAEGSDTNITVARSVHAAIGLLTARKARRVYVDGGKVIQSFLRHGLLDELTVSVAPVLLGAGSPTVSDRPARARSPVDWYPLFPNPVVAESLLDRLINTSHQIFMNGPSYRPRKSPNSTKTTPNG